MTGDQHRPSRNAHQAIRKVQAEVRAGRRIAVDIDLAKFFDTVNHDVLMGLLARSIGDKCLLALTGRYLRAGVWVGEHMEPSEVGTLKHYRPIPELEDWIRRRIRKCYWKQWRWPRTKIKNLVALGVNLITAIKHGVSSHGYWHIARTPGLQQALNDAWLKAQGLVSITDLWIKAQGYSAKKGH